MKSKTISIFMFMFMGCFALMACGGWRTSAEPSETIVSKAYNYEQVRGISVANGIVLNYSPAQQQENVRVTGPENVVAALEIKKDDATGELYFEIPGRYRFKYASDNQRLHIQVSIPGIYHFKAMNGASINVTDSVYDCPHGIFAETFSNSSIKFAGIQAPKVTFTSYTRSKIVAQMEAGDLDVQSYNSSVTVSGSAARFTVMASSATVDASQLSYQRISQTSLNGGEIVLKE